MVYCQKCGHKNEEGAEFCSSCGDDLHPYKHRKQKKMGNNRSRDECFGLPHGGLIVACIIGVLLILFGLSSIFGFELMYLGPALIIILGLLIILGAIYTHTHKD